MKFLGVELDKFRVRRVLAYRLRPRLNFLLALA